MGMALAPDFCSKSGVSLPIDETVRLFSFVNLEEMTDWPYIWHVSIMKQNKTKINVAS